MSSSSHLIGSVKAQTSKMPKEQELTINDIRQSRLVLLEGIDNAIQRLNQVRTQGDDAKAERDI